MLAVHCSSFLAIWHCSSIRSSVSLAVHIVQPAIKEPGQTGETLAMDRRSFIKNSGLAAAATASLSAPAIAQSSPELKWRMTSSFPRALDTIYGAADRFTKYVAEATDHKFQIQLFAAGEIVPGLEA